MNITESTTVAEITAALPSSVRVFQRHGVDFCCGGRRPIGVVCEEQGLSFEELAEAIAASAAEPAAGQQDWTRAPLHALIDHIVATYPDPLREELPRLETMAARVVQAHGAHASHLPRLEAVVRELAADLSAHMQKEEQVLFPAIRAIEAGNPAPLRIGNPIHVMEHEHDRAGALLAELRDVTGGYAAPEWACQTFRALYHGLAELEASMHVHVHLENNVLFPRALQRAESRG
jgi:regulator of cell morphogenesis and NO signaling